MPYCSTPEHVFHKDECIQASTTEVPEAAVSDTEVIEVIDRTPYKHAKYCSLKKKLTSRKRMRNPDTWQKNIHNRLHLSGAEYKGTSGKLTPVKHVQAIDCSKCTFKCSSKISHDNRQKIFSAHDDSESYCYMIDSISPNKKAILTDLFLENTKVKVKVDTGTKCNITPLETLHQISPNKTINTTKKLKLVGENWCHHSYNRTGSLGISNGRNEKEKW